jgi:putative transposase
MSHPHHILNYMPGRNTIKTYAINQYYHVYNRGVAKNPIFLDDQDKDYFLKLIDRYLNPDAIDEKNKSSTYTKYHDTLDLLCFCLMDKHFHLVF